MTRYPRAHLDGFHGIRAARELLPLRDLPLLDRRDRHERRLRLPGLCGSPPATTEQGR
ncbi:MAG: hypothetical protein WCE49_10100 [Terrimicrobiaceae bacterium]